MTFIPPRTTDPATTQGSVVVLDTAMPGGHLAWTVTRRLSGATLPLRLLDTLGDGQTFDAGFTPQVTLWTGGVASAPFSPTGWSVARNSRTGVSQIAFDLRLPPNAADSISLTFHSVIAPVLTAPAPLSQLVGQGDTLQNSAVLAGQADAAATASATLPVSSLSASVYAVNGVPVTGAVHAAFGDAVTYRLQLRLPLSATQSLQIVAVPPGTAGKTVFDASSTLAAPALGHAQWGPAASYTAAPPVVALDGAGGLRFQFGTIQPVYGAGTTNIDVLFTTALDATAGGSPPTLQASETESNSQGLVATGSASAALTLEMPRLSLQLASLYASGPDSQFAGSGGPWGFDTFTSQFGGVVSSAGLAAEPFDDRLWDVQAGDFVTFVIAAQNLAGGAATYDLRLRDTMPAGFSAPADGTGLSATDGAGNPLPVSGDLFDPAGFLQLGAPLAHYDPDSGANVALVTFTLQATSALQLPRAALTDRARIVGYAASPGGADQSANADAALLQASTSVTTMGPTLAATPRQTATTISSGQLAAFDVALTLPEGTTRDLRIDELLPRTAGSWLDLVSAELIHVGTSLDAPDRGTVQPDGSLQFGTVTNASDGVTDYADQIVLRLTVKGDGVSSGSGTLQTVASAADPNASGGRWSGSVSNTLAVQVPDLPPTIASTRAGQNATTSMQVLPLAGVTFSHADPAQLETLTVRLSDPALGRLGGTGPGAYDPATGSFTVTGDLATVQQAARALTFASAGARTGQERFTLTLDDGSGGITTDDSTTTDIAAAAASAAGIQHFALSTGTVLTSTVTGQQTVAQVEGYQGPVSYLQSQFIYDGAEPLAIVAQTPDVFIKSVAGSAAVQLMSGQNVVDAGHGSNFLLGGTGSDVFFLDGRQSQETWDTIVGFHPGDIATLFGFKAGVSRYWWDESAGAVGYTGRTLRADLTGHGLVEASLTFTGQTAADMAHYALTTGTVQNNDYLEIFNL